MLQDHGYKAVAFKELPGLLINLRLLAPWLARCALRILTVNRNYDHTFEIIDLYLPQGPQLLLSNQRYYHCPACPRSVRIHYMSSVELFLVSETTFYVCRTFSN